MMAGFEPATFRWTGGRSNQLSYITMVEGPGFEPGNPKDQIYSLAVLTTHPSFHLQTHLLKLKKPHYPSAMRLQFTLSNLNL